MLTFIGKTGLQKVLQFISEQFQSFVQYVASLEIRINENAQAISEAKLTLGKQAEAFNKMTKDLSVVSEHVQTYVDEHEPYPNTPSLGELLSLPCGIQFPFYDEERGREVTLTVKGWQVFDYMSFHKDEESRYEWIPMIGVICFDTASAYCVLFASNDPEHPLTKHPRIPHFANPDSPF